MIEKKLGLRVSHGQDESSDWFIRARVTDESGSTKTEYFSMAGLAVDTAPLMQFLGRTGRIPSRADKTQIVKSLEKRPKAAKFKLLTRRGWHGDLFATPYRVYGTADGPRPVLPPSADQDKWRPRGTLDEWQDLINRVATNNTLVRFGLSVAFLPPLLKLLNLRSVGFNFVGAPGLGKSTVLALLGSVWGCDPDKRLGFCETWRKTANGFDKVGPRYRCALLAIDEMHLAGATSKAIGISVGSVVHQLAGGETKETALSEQQPPQVFELVYVTCSNQSLREIFDAAKLDDDGSHRERLIEIGVYEPGGMFDRIPEGVTVNDFADSIIDEIKTVGGTAIDTFLDKLAQERRHSESELVAWLNARMQFMARQLSKIADGERTDKYFCAVYAAGCLAQRYKVLNWSKEQIRRAVIAAHAAHRQLRREMTGSSDLVGILRALVTKKRNKFTRVPAHGLAERAKSIKGSPGLVLKIGGDRYYGFTMQMLEVVYGTKERARNALQQLRKCKLLKHDKGKLSTKVSLCAGRGRERVYCVKASIEGRNSWRSHGADERTEHAAKLATE